MVGDSSQIICRKRVGRVPPLGVLYPCLKEVTFPYETDGQRMQRISPERQRKTSGVT